MLMYFFFKPKSCKVVSSGEWQKSRHQCKGSGEWQFFLIFVFFHHNNPAEKGQGRVRIVIVVLCNMLCNNVI